MPRARCGGRGWRSEGWAIKRILCSLLAALYLATAAAVPVYTASSFVVPLTAEAGVGKWALRLAVITAVAKGGPLIAKAGIAKLKQKFKEELSDPNTIRELIAAVREHVAKKPWLAKNGERVIAELQKHLDDLVAASKKAADKFKPGTHAYRPAPRTEEITGFRNLRPTQKKTPVQGGGKLRDRWKDDKGRIYEWDYQHRTLERYSKDGKRHLGEFDHLTGEQVGPPKPGRTVEP